MEKLLQDNVNDSALDADIRFQQVAVTRNLGVGAMLLGLVGMLGLPFSLLPFRSGVFALGSGAAGGGGGHMLFILFYDLIGAGLAFCAFMGGTGALTLRAWSRPLMFMYTIGQICLAAVAVCFFARWFNPTHGVEKYVFGEAAIAMTPLWLCVYGTVYSIAALYYLTRPGMKEALAGEWEDGAADLGAAGE